VGTIVTSFDVWAADLPLIEIYGSETSLKVPDPNGFGGPVKIWRKDDREWEDIPITRPYAQNSRGIGLVDMAYAIREGREARASGELTFHVLEAMNGFLKASAHEKHHVMASRCPRPEPLPAEWPGS
jgi:predicted dehydrogenase